MIDVMALPTVNAALNATAACLLAGGYVAIRRRKIAVHRALMISALVVSVAFLASYVTYHTLRQMQEGVGHTKYAGPASLAPVYYAVLISHLVLAIVNLPLVLITLSRALRGRYAAHARIARWAWPIWMYVSVTGVMVYIMLYHMV